MFPNHVHKNFQVVDPSILTSLAKPEPILCWDVSTSAIFYSHVYTASKPCVNNSLDNVTLNPNHKIPICLLAPLSDL